MPKHRYSIPGLENYPDLRVKFERELARLGNCSDCAVAELIASYTAKLQERRNRNKLYNPKRKG